MAVSESFRTYVLDQLSRVAPGVRGRSMFGGVGIYAGELFFALIADDTLYFKVDESNRPDFEARDLGPFRPYGEGGEVMQYYQVPDDALEDAEALRPWAEKAIDVARRKKGGRGRRLPLVVLGLLAVSPLGCGRTTQLPVREGYVTTDDSVRLYDRIVGEGAETVVVPVALYLEELLAPLARPGRRLVFYDPRHRGRSGRGGLARVTLDRQIEDLEQLRAALGIERMALVGWSGLGTETAAYAIRHPGRVTRLVQVGAVPPAARLLQEAGGDRRSDRMDREAIAALDRRFDAGEFARDPAAFCRARDRLTLPSNFADPALAARVPDVCRWENEWPVHLWPFFRALLRSFGDYDWLDEIAALDVPRLVIHGREDGIPLASARAWAAGFPNARLLVLSPAGHFPFLEQPEAFFPAVERFLAGEWPPGAERVEQGR